MKYNERETIIKIKTQREKTEKTKHTNISEHINLPTTA